MCCGNTLVIPRAIPTSESLLLHHLEEGLVRQKLGLRKTSLHNNDRGKAAQLPRQPSLNRLRFGKHVIDVESPPNETQTKPCMSSQTFEKSVTLQQALKLKKNESSANQ